MKIKPFKGIRPPKDVVEQVQSRPYDVLNSEEARAEAQGNEKSLYHIIKPEIDFPSAPTSMTRKSMRKRRRTSKRFKTKGGWYRTIKNSTTSTPRRWMERLSMG